MCIHPRLDARGFTLFELLLLIIVLAIGLGGILLAINTNVMSSADPMVRKQAMAAAESMMEEILLQPFATGGWSGAATQANRASFDDVRDYCPKPNPCFSTSGIYTVDGTVVSGLSAYNLSVDVAGAAIGTSPFSVSSANSLLVTVTVTGPSFTYVLEGYKLNY